MTDKTPEEIQAEETARLEQQERERMEAAEQSDETAPAEERLRAAEDKLLGEDVPRHNGRPEKGSASRHASLPPAHLAHLHALEHLVTVETEHATAERAMQDADAKLAHALKRADDTEVEV